VLQDDEMKALESWILGALEGRAGKAAEEPEEMEAETALDSAG
jgi:hypothetical protein